MIRSFRNAETRGLFEGQRSKRFGNVQRIIERKLAMLNAARILSDLAVPPNNRLHALDRDRAGQHAISVNDQYRICFRWTADGPEDVEVTDYH